MRRRPEAVKNKTVSTQNRLTSITLDVENQTTKLKILVYTYSLWNENNKTICTCILKYTHHST